MKSTLLPKKPVVLVDMDGVLANFEKGCLTEYRQRDSNLPYVELEDRETHDIKQQYDTLEGGG